MITIYGMPSCPDCSYVESQVSGNDQFQFIDIGAHVKNLKAFLRLRDTSPVFDDAKTNGYAGIPCFVKEDGSVTCTVPLPAASPEDAPKFFKAGLE